MTSLPPFTSAASVLRISRSPSLSSWPPIISRGPASAMRRLQDDAFGDIRFAIATRCEGLDLRPDGLDAGGGQDHDIAGLGELQRGLGGAGLLLDDMDPLGFATRVQRAFLQQPHDLAAGASAIVRGFAEDHHVEEGGADLAHFPN